MPAADDPAPAPPPPRRVLLTGARGTTSVPLAALLARQGDVEVLGGSSRPEAVDLEGVTPTRLSWDDPAGWPAALDGVDAVYVVLPIRSDAPEILRDVLADVDPGTRVVLLSERNADDGGPDGWTVRAERAVRDSGLPWTVLRPSWFMQVLTDPRFFGDAVRQDGELPFADGGAPVAWIDARDIAAVAERALVSDGLLGRVLELSGPESLTLRETAARLAAAAGRPVSHRSTSVEEAVAGSDGFERALSAYTFERVAAGRFAEVTGTVAEVTGRPARSLGQYLHEVGL
ncbi:NAD(P)H-binding protein [Aquipuribacter sp. SD81]|uniref:NAD(P)H-binding protein n=1 Tax=Aquipuribacter sp. SD81 TaxID=3127703 RepID=UPI003018B974